jgi:endoribonuclease Dicer
VGDYEDDVIVDEDKPIYDSDEELEKEREGEEREKEGVKTSDRLQLRDYQNILFNRSLESNRIIYLPTGKGKTMVSIASMYYYLCKEGESKKIVFLANTIQLVKQQADSIKKNLEKIMENEELSNSLRRPGAYDRVKWDHNEIKLKVCEIHGEKVDDIGMTRRTRIEAELSSKKEILEMFRKSTVIVMIAQMFLNCLRRGYIKITDFSFMVFD